MTENGFYLDHMIGLVNKQLSQNFKKIRNIKMRDLIILCFFLAYVLLGSGCAPSQNGAGLYEGAKNGLLQMKGGEICRDIRSGKMWQVEKKGRFSSLQEAEEYATTLELGGYDDWRLPTKSELFDLDYIFYWKKNNDCTMNRNGEFWSASEDQEVSLGHWEAYQVCGPEFKYVEASKEMGYVRAVRP